jgi:asparagine synthase (glutamine-hydrolysing)
VPQRSATARALCEVFSPAERRALLHGDAGVAPFAASDPPGDVDAALAFDLDVYLPDDLLYKVDTASMRFGVESRAPLLDLPLARAVVPLPAAAKAGKRLLKAAVEDLLPAQILAREKRGFGSPVARWLSGPLRPMLDDLVRSPSARIRTFLDPREVDRTLARALAPRGNPHQAWALFALEVWARAN